MSLPLHTMVTIAAWNITLIALAVLCTEGVTSAAYATCGVAALLHFVAGQLEENASAPVTTL